MDIVPLPTDVPEYARTIGADLRPVNASPDAAAAQPLPADPTSRPAPAARYARGNQKDGDVLVFEENLQVMLFGGLLAPVGFWIVILPERRWHGAVRGWVLTNRNYPGGPIEVAY